MQLLHPGSRSTAATEAAAANCTTILQAAQVTIYCNHANEGIIANKSNVQDVYFEASKRTQQPGFDTSSMCVLTKAEVMLRFCGRHIK